MARNCTQDVYTHLKQMGEIGDRFNSTEIGEAADMRTNQASAALWMLAKFGMVEPVGKRGHSIVYELVKLKIDRKFKRVHVENVTRARAGGPRPDQRVLPRMPDEVSDLLDLVSKTEETKKTEAMPEIRLSARLRALADEIEEIECAVDRISDRLRNRV